MRKPEWRTVLARKAQIALSWTLIFLCLCTSATGTREIVLCLGQDGHVALEPAHAPTCDGEDGVPESAGLDGGCVRERHHGNCVDLVFPLQTAYVVAPAKRPLLATLSYVEGIAPDSDVMADAAATKPLFVASAAKAGPAPAIRHTILLI